MRIKASWTEAMEGFPDAWDGYCSGREVFGREHYRVSELLGPDGEPLQIGYNGQSSASTCGGVNDLAPIPHRPQNRHGGRSGGLPWRGAVVGAI